MIGACKQLFYNTVDFVVKTRLAYEIICFAAGFMIYVCTDASYCYRKSVWIGRLRRRRRCVPYVGQFSAITFSVMTCFSDSESIKEKIHMNKEPVVVNVLAVLLVFVLIIVSYTVRRESIKRRSNNRPSYTGTVSPMRIKSSSSTGKFGSGKQSTQLPVWADRSYTIVYPPSSLL